MTFTPKVWKDGKAGGTPITAAELNRIESGVALSAQGTKGDKGDKGDPGDISVLTLDVHSFGAVGDGSTDDTAAIQAAIAAADAAGGGNILLRRKTYAHTGIVFPATANDGFVSLIGVGVNASQLINTHATNPSVSISGPGGGQTTRHNAVRDITITSLSAQDNQVGLDVSWAVKWDTDRVRILNHGVGIKMATSWAGAFRNTHVENCTVGFRSELAPSGGSSSPVVIENMTIYGCPTGVLSEDGLVSVTWHGGTIGNSSIVGLQMNGSVNAAVSLYGVNFENNAKDVQLGDADSGPKSVLFSNCLFLSHAPQALSVFNQHGLNITFDTCYWWCDHSPDVVALGVQVGSPSGTVTFINPRFEGVTTHVQTPTGTYQVPAGTSVWSAVGFGASPGISRIGSGVSMLPQTSTITSSATPAINVDTVNTLVITAQAVPITSMTSGLTGVSVDGQDLTVIIKDNGTAQTIAWGSAFSAANGKALPTTTTVGQLMILQFKKRSSTWFLI